MVICHVGHGPIAINKFSMTNSQFPAKMRFLSGASTLFCPLGPGNSCRAVLSLPSNRQPHREMLILRKRAHFAQLCARFARLGQCVQQKNWCFAGKTAFD
jgi:hypothetical protein